MSYICGHGQSGCLKKGNNYHESTVIDKIYEINTEKSPVITLNNRRLHKQNKQYVALSSQTKLTKTLNIRIQI